MVKDDAVTPVSIHIYYRLYIDILSVLSAMLGASVMPVSGHQCVGSSCTCVGASVQAVNGQQ